MTKIPSISIIVITLNNRRTIENCCKSILSQTYPKQRIDLLNVDGGSTDGTTEIMKNYGFRCIVSPIKHNAEAQRAIGLKEAKNNLLVSVDADNYLPERHWIERMTEPFIENPDVVHAATLHYTYRKTDTVYNRYCALFGLLDPVVYYVGRPDREMQTVHRPSHGQIICETKNYFIVRFTKESLTTVGCNGVVYRRDILLKHARSSHEEFLHIDVFADLIPNGFTTFAVVKNDVIHDTAVNIPQLLKKRIAFLEGYYLNDTTTRPKRRYLIYDPKNKRDMIRLILYIAYTITMIKPFYDSLKGYVRIRDSAWFLHPLMCWVYLISYGTATINQSIRK